MTVCPSGNSVRPGRRADGKGARTIGEQPSGRVGPVGARGLGSGGRGERPQRRRVLGGAGEAERGRAEGGAPVVDLHAAGAKREDALAVADKVLDRLHDEDDGRQHRRIGGPCGGEVAGAEVLVDADGVVDRLGGQHQPGTAGLQALDHLEAAAPVEDRDAPVRRLDHLGDVGRRALALQPADVRMLAAEGCDLVGAEAAAEIGRRILDRDRKGGRSGNPAEETDVLAGRVGTNHRRLEDDPVGVDGLGMARAGDLLRHRAAEDRQAERLPPGIVLGDPVHHGEALRLGELGDFGGKAQRGNAVGPGGKARFELAPHRAAVEALVCVEQRVEDGVDAVEGGRRHAPAPCPSRRSTIRMWSAASTTSPRWLITSQRSTTRPDFGRFGSSSLAGDRHPGADGIADEHRADEAQPVVAVGEGDRVDQRRGQPDADREHHRAVGDALAERRRPGELGVHVVREEVAGVAGMDDEVGLGDGPAGGLPHIADPVVLEVDGVGHRRSCRRMSARL